jgi:hypothetical protein
MEVLLVQLMPFIAIFAILYLIIIRPLQKKEKKQRRFESGIEERVINTGRERIPKEVQREVWRRDNGKCVECGSQEKLEYDHIIPVSKGGSNTARNIQLLCEKCNRKKGASI